MPGREAVDAYLRVENQIVIGKVRERFRGHDPAFGIRDGPFAQRGIGRFDQGGDDGVPAVGGPAEDRVVGDGNIPSNGRRKVVASGEARMPGAAPRYRPRRDKRG